MTGGLRVRPAGHQTGRFTGRTVHRLLRHALVRSAASFGGAAPVDQVCEEGVARRRIVTLRQVTSRGLASDVATAGIIIKRIGSTGLRTPRTELNLPARKVRAERAVCGCSIPLADLRLVRSAAGGAAHLAAGMRMLIRAVASQVAKCRVWPWGGLCCGAVCDSWESGWR
jgi:hypothetical protein